MNPSHPHPKKQLSLLIASTLTASLFSQPLLADSFTIRDGETITTEQTLSNNETGTVDTGGKLNVTGSNAITSSGDNITVTNNGIITTEGRGFDGIHSTGDNAIITNSRSIAADGGDGIESRGVDVTITNSGSITVGGNGIDSRGESAVITNSGSITSGNDGIYSFTSNGATTITNNGSITSSNIGINSSSFSADITNNGSITSGNKGIYLSGENAVITNTGSITANRAGIYSAAENTTITNSGFISAKGVDSFAIISESGTTTLNLESGSRIIGRIDLGGGNTSDIVNISGGNTSSQITFESTEVVNLINGATGVVKSNGNDKIVTTVDTTGESTRGIALAGLTGDLHSVINQRMSHDAPLKPVKVASLELSSDMVFNKHQPEAWGQAFGGRFERDNDGSALAYEHTHVGVSFGYDFDVNNSRFGVMGGYANASTDTEVDSFKTDADNFFMGVYSAYKFNGLRLTTALLSGFGQHDNRRTVIDNLAGIQTAKSDFNSSFISPSIGLSSAYKVNETLELRPSINLNYSVAWLDGYTETGTTNSNLSVDDRKAKAFTAKAQLEAAYRITPAYELAVRAGINSRHTDDEQTKVSLAGQRFSFANSGDDSVTGGFVGFNFRQVTISNLALVADIEVGGASKEDYINGYVGMNYTF